MKINNNNGEKRPIPKKSNWNHFDASITKLQDQMEHLFQDIQEFDKIYVLSDVAMGVISL